MMSIVELLIGLSSRACKTNYQISIDLMGVEKEEEIREREKHSYHGINSDAAHE